jgi:hypothetical protein
MLGEPLPSFLRRSRCRGKPVRQRFSSAPARQAQRHGTRCKLHAQRRAGGAVLRFRIDGRRDQRRCQRDHVGRLSRDAARSKHRFNGARYRHAAREGSIYTRLRLLLLAGRERVSASSECAHKIVPDEMPPAESAAGATRACEATRPQGRTFRQTSAKDLDSVIGETPEWALWALPALAILIMLLPMLKR